MKTYVLTVREQHESMSLGLKLKTYREEVVESDDRRQPLQRIIEVVDEIGGPYAWNRCVRDRRRKNVFRYVLPDGRVVEAREETVDQRTSRLGREEVERFKREAPRPLVAHLLHGGTRAWAGDKVGTAAGDKLGVVTTAREPWRSNMGDVRQSVRVLGINGAVYGGTAYVSAGDLVRLRPIKTTTKGAS